MIGVEKVELLGTDGPLPFERDGQGLHIALPQAPANDRPLCLKIRLL